jgi:peptide/nickel transport system ATP-binding protein
MSQESTLLDIQNLNVDLLFSTGYKRVVSDVSIQLAAGKSLAIVGETGAGKTMTAKAIMRLLPKFSKTEGKIFFDNVNITETKAKDFRKITGGTLSMVFQDPYASLNPVKRVGHQIAEVIKLHARNRRTKEKVLQLLADVKIKDPERSIKKYPHELSGGERQRVVLAIALAAGPKLLIADEPTTSLDVLTQAQILALIKAHVESNSASMILITHDLGLAIKYCDDICVMYKGEIIEYGAAIQVISKPLMPYTEALVACMPKIDSKPHERLLTIKSDENAPVSSGCRFAARCPYAISGCFEFSPSLFSDIADHPLRCFFPIGSPEFEALRMYHRLKQDAGEIK